MQFLGYAVFMCELRYFLSQKALDFKPFSRESPTVFVANNGR